MSAAAWGVIDLELEVARLTDEQLAEQLLLLAGRPDLAPRRLGLLVAEVRRRLGSEAVAIETEALHERKAGR